jgi:hypothetical protein
MPGRASMSLVGFLMDFKWLLRALHIQIWCDGGPVGCRICQTKSLIISVRWEKRWDSEQCFERHIWKPRSMCGDVVRATRSSPLRPLTPWHAVFLWAARHTDASYIPDSGPCGYAARRIPRGLLVTFWELYYVIGVQRVRAMPFEIFQYYRLRESTNIVVKYRRNGGYTS